MLKSHLGLKGRYYIEHRNADGRLLGIYRVPNGIVDVGMEALLETTFRNGTQYAAWYMGLVDNAGWTSFADADTMASHAGWSESTAYSQANRVQWSPDAAASRQVTNGSAVEFSINGTETLKGVFIVSDNTKSGSSGILWSTAAFASTVAVQSGDTLKVTYTVSG